MKYLLPFLVIFLASCGEKTGTKKSVIHNTSTVEIEDESPREPVTFTRPSIKLPASAFADFNRVKKKHRYVPFFCTTQDGNLFVTSKKAFVMNDLFNKKILKTSLFGLCAENGDTLLKNEYDRIGNPGLFSDGIIEVHNEKGYALFDYINKRFIGEIYDIIFPSKIKGYLAIAKKNEAYFKLYDDGTVRKLNENEFRPDYQSIRKHLIVDTRSEDFGLWVNTELFKAEWPESESAGLFVTPSYLRNLGIFPDLIPGITLEGSESGIEDFHTSKVASRKRNKKTQSLLISFVEKGIDARGWTTEQHHIVTTDKQNKVKDKRKVNSLSDYAMQNSCENCIFSGSRFVNDSILEVRYWLYADNEFAKKGMDTLFIAMTQFSYYAISPEGKIKALHEGSLFPMASIIELNQDYLRGCFLKSSKQFPGLYDLPVKEGFDAIEDQSDQWVAELDHLTALDIRFMINEIYARHGYIFSDRRFDNYFKSQKWYKGTSRNVDAKLTPLEKQNIYFLQSIEKQLMLTNGTIRKPERKLLYWAG
jgi:hypothetical protein